jgi:hypothetical protein
MIDRDVKGRVKSKRLKAGVKSKEELKEGKQTEG